MRSHAVALVALVVAGGGVAPGAIGHFTGSSAAVDQPRAAPRVVTRLEDARLKFEIDSTREGST